MKKKSQPNRFFMELLVYRDRLRSHKRRLVIRLQDFPADDFALNRLIPPAARQR